MFILYESLSENIYHLKSSRHMGKKNSMSLKSLMDEVTINLYILGPFMEDWIVAIWIAD